MTVTESVGQVSGNAAAEETENDVYDARARDGQRTPFSDSLPDTERVQEALTGFFERLRDLASSLWNGSFWDEQPPSPRELYERYRESPWKHSEYGLLRALRRVGMVLSIGWSIPLYGLAIAGQTIGRVACLTLFITLIWKLI